MSFHEIRFPTNISYGAAGGPIRRTEIVTLANGFEERNNPWQHARRKYDAGTAVQSLNDLDKILHFFEARRGQLYGFRWKDWADYKSCPPSDAVAQTDQNIGTGDGSQTEFQLVKLYQSGMGEYTRPISKPVADTVMIAVDGSALTAGVDFTVSLGTGTVHCNAAPQAGAVVTAGFEFDVPVRFDTDQIVTSLAHFQAGEVPSAPVVEVRI